jgi:uncharacterized protein with NRDE domain
LEIRNWLNYHRLRIEVKPNVVMCLIVFAYRVHPSFPVIIAANRDEFYARPTAALGEWPDAPHVVAGRDLKGGGTWMGINRKGHLAALTNFREPGRQRAEAPSRGHLVSDFLRGEEKLNRYIEKLSLTSQDYNGYNIILSDGSRWVYLSNRNHAPRKLSPGIYGLSNHLLNTPWPKVQRSRLAVEHLLTSGSPPAIPALMAILQDRTVPPDAALPHTGVGLEWERRLGSIFIHSAIYGTRSSTVLLLDREGTARICERTFDVEGFVGQVDTTLHLPAPI